MDPVVAPATGATFAGCPVFPPESDWNRDISAEAVDPHSADYLSEMQASTLRLRGGFGPPPYGFPINLVGAGQPRVPMAFTWAASSDPGPYPFPQNVVRDTNADRHAIVFDRDACMLYETYNTWPDGKGGFRADAGAVWNVRSGALRPDGWTSATAAGLPILAGLVKYEEVAEVGEIRHALIFSSPATAHAYVHPATHSSGTSSAPYAPPMGLRIRLRADFDLSRFSGASRLVLGALRKHGAFVTDNQTGLPFWPILGTQDSRWDLANLEQLKTVPTSAFEVVRLGQARAGN
ncbi:MAG: hypothetical protein NVS2B9_12680 [Myxococcales bacterium]